MHEWKTPARNSAEPERTWAADEAGLWLDGELVGFPEPSREVLRLAQALEDEENASAGLRLALEESDAVRLDYFGEIALLRRERALLIELDKTRGAIIAGLLSGAVPAVLAERVAELNAALFALHLEARGGVHLPDGAPCGCLLCAPRVAIDPEYAAKIEPPEIEQGVFYKLPVVRPGFRNNGGEGE